MRPLRALDRKLLRDLWRMRLQVAAIALLIACGVSVAVMAASTERALKIAQARDYQRARFADVFATATRAPASVARDLAQINGVLAVDARATKGGLMQVAGLLRPATARLIALPDDERTALNRIVLINGRMPDPNRSDEAVALKTFLDAAHVRLGQRVNMVIDGRRLGFVIVGSALAAEFAYLPGAASSMPDDAHQGVFWAPRPLVERATGLGGAFSTVSLKLAPGASEGAVLRAVDRALAPYGGQPAYPRRDQVSSRFQDEHIKQLGVMAIVFPPVFLIVAALLVHLVLGRVVETEREQIGLLKAFGYGDFATAENYLKLAALIAVIGSIAGGLFGGWLGGVVTGIFFRYVRFTAYQRQFAWSAFAIASTVSVAAAMSGSLLAVRRAVRLSPAVAMRPPAPPSYRRGVFEHIGLWPALDQPTRMIVRGIERYPGRAAMTLLGLALSLSLLVGTQFVFGSIDEIVDQAYFRARHWTDLVGFAEVRDSRAITAAARLPGVIAAEPLRAAPARVRAHGHEEQARVVGLDPGARLTRALDVRERPLPVPANGVLLSDSLAARLGVHAGDRVELEVYENRRPLAVVRVMSVFRDYAGLTVYMDRRALDRLVGQGDVSNAATLVVAPDQRRRFYDAVAATPMVVSAASRDDTVGEWRRSMASTVTVEMAFYVGFAAAVAFAITYNITRINLADRGRDLATLRVLGFGQVECLYILAGEVAVLALAATPLGVLGGYGLARWMTAAFSHQDIRLPLVVTRGALGVAVLAYGAAVAVATALVGQRIWRFDLVSVLKTRE